MVQEIYKLTKQDNQMKNLLIAASMVMLSACGGGETETNDNVKSVMFTLDPVTGADCPNADDLTVFTNERYQSVNCTWLCADYGVHSSAYVSITFERLFDGTSEWVIDRDYVSGGIC